jgi:phosphoglycerol transferase MdoB-like AlkP superfamily enzyme
MENWNIDSPWIVGSLFYWSLFNDCVAIACLNLPFFLLLSLPLPFRWRSWFSRFLLFTTIALNSFALALSLLDSFYFRFHLQRADADLLYVLFNPFTRGSLRVYIYAAIALITVFVLFKTLIRPYKKNLNELHPQRAFRSTALVLSAVLVLTVIFQKKQFHPNYALTAVNYRQLPLVQNSLHCFVYSLYRNDEFEAIQHVSNNIPNTETKVEIKKKNAIVSPTARNLVLFIMESVPYEYFDTSSPYHLSMPFLDSLRERSLLFNKAYSFSYNSNKGITALLAGLPTATDIPLYHSRFTMMPHTGIGFALKQKGYHSSFIIGDDYDDFGFAKCSNWLGIDRYFCRKDILNDKALPQHPLGLHDEAVLPFLLQQLDQSPAPFLAIHYNISTHYPYDLPASFILPEKGKKLSKPGQTMLYYDHCLSDFFNKAKNKSWFNNTVFIFCSDHWSKTYEKNDPIDPEKSFRIPLFIYDPQDPVKKIHSSPVSQLDILNTLLAYAAYSDSLISYGVNLMETPEDPQRVVFTKLNNAIYQAIDQDYILGYNVYEGKPAYVYDLKNDPSRTNNLILKSDNRKIDTLITQLRAFLRTVSLHYLETNNKH